MGGNRYLGCLAGLPCFRRRGSVPLAAPLLGAAIVVTGALYFADRRMKTDDNHFRGFPALWNGAAFYLFLLKPPALAGSIVLAVLVVLTFVPFHVMHPIRTTRFRMVNIVLLGVWAVLAIIAIAANFQVPAWTAAALCVVGGYILLSDVAIRLLGLNRT